MNYLDEYKKWCESPEFDEETKKVPDENIVRHFNIYLLLCLGKAMRDPEFVSLGGTYGQDFACL